MVLHHHTQLCSLINIPSVLGKSFSLTILVALQVMVPSSEALQVMALLSEADIVLRLESLLHVTRKTHR